MDAQPGMAKTSIAIHPLAEFGDLTPWMHKCA